MTDIILNSALMMFSLFALLIHLCDNKTKAVYISKCILNTIVISIIVVLFSRDHLAIHVLLIIMWAITFIFDLLVILLCFDEKGKMISEK